MPELIETHLQILVRRDSDRMACTRDIHHSLEQKLKEVGSSDNFLYSYYLLAIKKSILIFSFFYLPLLVSCSCVLILSFIIPLYLLFFLYLLPPTSIPRFVTPFSRREGGVTNRRRGMEVGGHDTLS